jgi:ribosomal protein S18 acetylase RimI-like enzyme
MSKNTVEIYYTSTDEQGLDATCALREKLIEHHKVRSKHFYRRYADMPPARQRNFELREKYKDGLIRVDLAREKAADTLVGYCITTISRDNQGEIQSIYVEPEYRQYGIGDALMKLCLQWLDEHAVIKKVLGVGAGNEDVFEFYSKYNFFPRTIILEQVEEGKK